MSDKERIEKIIEVAAAAAAADGIEAEEAMGLIENIMPIVAVGETMESVLEEAGVEGQVDVNFEDVIEVIPNLMDIIQGSELIELNDDYMEEASKIIGDGLVINNLCMALCLLISAADEEISGAERAANATVANGLINLDQELINIMVKGLILSRAEMSEMLD
ncbi:MAG: hypothetical protein VX469_03500 [Pseudomonadota bacterium]|nr:hypothetical protein [Pseudomonadota bacterium]